MKALNRSQTECFKWNNIFLTQILNIYWKISLCSVGNNVMGNKL